MSWILYTCAIIGAIILLFIFWALFLGPIYLYLKRAFIFYILKKVRIAHSDTYLSFFFGPTSIEILTYEEFEKRYNRKPRFKDSY